MLPAGSNCFIPIAVAMYRRVILGSWREDFSAGVELRAAIGLFW